MAHWRSAWGLLVVAIAIAGFAAVVLVLAGRGVFGGVVSAGRVEPRPLATEVVRGRDARVQSAAAALEAVRPGQILFGDLHVHSSFSMDAFQLTLPTNGGEGVHPVADACDFARYCAQLDFWSINDHANSLSPRRWRDTIDAIRQCQATTAGVESPDLTSFLGWEWTQMGSTPENHYGHKNVILRDLEDGSVPTRPIAAAPPAGVPSTFDTGSAGALTLGLGAFLTDGGHDTMRTLAELGAVGDCPADVAERDLPADCREAVATPAELFERLDDWGVASLVIPHGTTWGMYTPAGSSWAKQLDPRQHDPDRQRLIEVYSGHGSAEEYRPWVATRIEADGTRSCPEPTESYLPTCWRAGEIIRDRCRAEALAPEECDARAAQARQDFVDADRNAGPWTVPGLRPEELLDAGQCRDCFQPAFNHRPLGSVQSMLARSRPGPSESADPQRFRFGFIASSDNHTARAGTGYKEVARRHFTDTRMGEVGRSSLVTRYRRDPVARSERFDPADRIPSVAFLETERGGSFMLTGGLVALHARSRRREDIWNALMRRETYATSGPRILLWFDLLDPDAPEGGVWPMGSEVATSGEPMFRVRAVGSFEQQPGCPSETTDVLTADRLAFLCRGECENPSDRRRAIARIEVVRIRSQRDPDEPIGPLIEDPWRVFDCGPDPIGCERTFSDPDFATAGRDASYYVRAIEVASPVIDADPLGCERDESGTCVAVHPCLDRPDDDDCLAPSEQRAWSSPIFVDFEPGLDVDADINGAAS
jgi:hypothetical protein